MSFTINRFAKFLYFVNTIFELWNKEEATKGEEMKEKYITDLN
jgi:hypothetical protein